MTVPQKDKGVTSEASPEGGSAVSDPAVDTRKDRDDTEDTKHVPGYASGVEDATPQVPLSSLLIMELRAWNSSLDNLLSKVWGDEFHPSNHPRFVPDDNSNNHIGGTIEPAEVDINPRSEALSAMAKLGRDARSIITIKGKSSSKSDSENPAGDPPAPQPSSKIASPPKHTSGASSSVKVSKSDSSSEGRDPIVLFFKTVLIVCFLFLLYWAATETIEQLDGRTPFSPPEQEEPLPPEQDAEDSPSDPFSDDPSTVLRLPFLPGDMPIGFLGAGLSMAHVPQQKVLTSSGSRSGHPHHGQGGQADAGSPDVSNSVRDAIASSPPLPERFLDLDAERLSRLLTVLPVDLPVRYGRVSSVFGYRPHPVTGEERLHQGIDFAVVEGTPVRATGSGLVSDIGYDPRGYGHYIRLHHEDTPLESVYAHLRSAPSLSLGERVHRGDVIGSSGNTGLSTGPHLHYGVYDHVADAYLNPTQLFDTYDRAAATLEVIHRVDVESDEALAVQL